MTSSREFTFVILVFLVTTRNTYAAGGSHVSSCPDNQFSCADGECILHHWVCDNTDDCPDGEDEEHCENHCLTHYFHCKSGDACIPPTWVCNGTPDCPDSSDEEGPDCKKKLSACKKPQVLCDDQYDCIYPTVKCDGFLDCQDGSDEKICDHLNCLDGEFACGNKERCIPDKWQCDGHADCQDGSDEKFCDEDCSILDGLFMCGATSQCIVLSRVCDGHGDCTDHTDEHDNCTASCDSVLCQHSCQQMPNGPGVCVCAAGYKLASDHTDSCTDLDECVELSVSPCSQICHNVPGSYTCSCHDGYRLANDKHACKAEASDAVLVYGVQTMIRSVNLHTGDFSDIHEKLHAVNALAYDLVSERLFWSDGEDKAVYASYMNSHISPVITTGLLQPEGLAVDWIGRSLYVIDSAKRTIIVCSLTQFVCTTLIRDLQQPKNIVIDAVNRYLYWTDMSTPAYIGRSTLDGTIQPRFVSSNIEYPMGLFLDYGRERLFWTDMRSKTIESIRLDGTDRKMVSVENMKLPFSVAVFEDTLIWTDQVKDGIFLSNMTSGRKLKRVTKVTGPASILIMHPTQQPTGINPCLASQCDHVCVPADASSHPGYRCLCAPGYDLDEEDYSTCTERGDNKYLLISRHGQIVRVPLDYIGNEPPVSIISAPKLGNVIALDYNPSDASVIYSDVERDVIASINLKEKYPQEKIWVHQGLQTVEDLAVDCITSNLYWTDSQKKTVEVSRLDGKSRLVLIKSDIYKPQAIVIHPVKRYIIISCNYPSGSHIVRANLDGSEQTEIITDAGRVYGMYMDVQSSVLYWVDSQFGNLESCELDGSSRHIVKEGLKHPYSLTLAMGYFYWTNGETSQVQSLAMQSDHVTTNNLGATSSSDSGMMGIISILPRNYSETPKASSRCYPFNGGCSALCFTEPNDETRVLCRCPTGQQLNEDLKTCRDHDRCGKDEFECTTSGQCIALSQRCDGIIHCPDAEDEHSKCFECEFHQYRCASGQCIPKAFVCDGDKECNDGSDEGEAGGCNEETCQAGYFQCDPYTCIANLLVCDKFRDCLDGQDEMNCQEMPPHSNNVIGNDECVDDMYQCVNDTKCISAEFVCDKFDDCPYGDDENCPVTCDSDEVLCPDGDCIAKSMLCDELNDCSNGWDEANCSAIAKVAQCDDGQFPCQSGGLCLSEKWVCDGTEDCDGGEDEVKTLCVCGLGLFHCQGSDTCIHMNKVCDNTSDCEDSSDEGALCGPVCSQACSQICRPTPAGGICACYHGYILQKDRKTCKDLDECMGGESQCSQLCINAAGSYRCLCRHGYSLHVDKKTCKADGRRPYLLIGRSSKISILSYDGHHISSLPYKTPAPVISIDNLGQSSVYWSTEKAVFVDGEHLKLNISSVGSVVVDWVAKNIYITEPSGGNILACSVNGTHCITIVRRLGEPRGLAVYPQKGLMFWTETRSPGKICHSWMDGSNPATLVFGGMSEPVYITVDYSTDKLYWVDTDLGNLETADLDGRNRRLMLHQANAKLFGIDVFEDWIILGDWTRKEIKRVKHSGDKEEVIRGNISHPVSVRVVHAVRKPNAVNNGCSNLACDCLCLLTPGGGRCKSPDDVMPRPPLRNNTDCNSNDTFCMNSAVCKMVDQVPQCICSPGFTGIRCEQHLGPAISSSTAISMENVTMEAVTKETIGGEHAGNSHMWIVGVVVMVLLIGIIIAVLWLYLKKKKYRKGLDIFTLIRYHNPLSKRNNSEESQTIVHNTEQLSFTNPGFEEGEEDDMYSDINSNKIHVCIRHCSFSTSEDSLDSAIESARTSIHSSKECTYRNFPIDDNM